MALQTPGSFFLGTLAADEQKFIKTLLKNAKKAGYTRLIEPCAGAFAMSHLGVQVGFKQANIETSDVTMFSSIYGNAIMGKSLEEYELKAGGFSAKEMEDPAIALYAIIYYKTIGMATNEIVFAMAKDIELSRDYHIKTIQEYIDRAKESLNGFSYRALDMYDHLEEVLDDPKAIVVMNPPTYTAGFEKWYDFKGKVTWKEPKYQIFDPVTGLPELMQNRCKDAKALCICYEENEVGQFAGHPIFATYGVRKDINIYLTTNQPEKAVKLSEGKRISRKDEKSIGPLNCSILPQDYPVTNKSKITIEKIEESAAFYYRAMWTHNFVGGKSQINVLLLIDGFVAGVFGIQTAFASAAVGRRMKDVLLMYGMTRPHDSLRLGRLLNMIGMDKSTLLKFIPEHVLREFRVVQTIQMTKHKESKEMRGLMKLVERKDGKLGYKLVYWAKMTQKTYKQILTEFLAKEQKWQKERNKSLQK